MKRTDLIALAERLPTLIDMLPPGIRATAEVDLCHIADFARQIAESQPVAWADCQGEPSKHRVYDYTHPLYTLPLED